MKSTGRPYIKNPQPLCIYIEELNKILADALSYDLLPNDGEKYALALNNYLNRLNSAASKVINAIKALDANTDYVIYISDVIKFNMFTEVHSLILKCNDDILTEALCVNLNIMAQGFADRCKLLLNRTSNVCVNVNVELDKIFVLQSLIEIYLRQKQTDKARQSLDERKEIIDKHQITCKSNLRLKTTTKKSAVADDYRYLSLYMDLYTQYLKLATLENDTAHIQEYRALIEMYGLKFYEKTKLIGMPVVDVYMSKAKEANLVNDLETALYYFQKANESRQLILACKPRESDRMKIESAFKMTEFLMTQTKIKIMSQHLQKANIETPFNQTLPAYFKPLISIKTVGLHENILELICTSPSINRQLRKHLHKRKLYTNPGTETNSLKIDLCSVNFLRLINLIEEFERLTITKPMEQNESTSLVKANEKAELIEQDVASVKVDEKAEQLKRHEINKAARANESNLGENKTNVATQTTIPNMASNNDAVVAENKDKEVVLTTTSTETETNTKESVLTSSNSNSSQTSSTIKKQWDIELKDPKIAKKNLHRVHTGKHIVTLTYYGSGFLTQFESDSAKNKTIRVIESGVNITAHSVGYQGLVFFKQDKALSKYGAEYILKSKILGPHGDGDVRGLAKRVTTGIFREVKNGKTIERPCQVFKFDKVAGH